ncbi:MAG: cation transporter [bacterium]|nr:cation transporter [bacterium]
MRWRKNRSARRGDSREALFEVTGMSCGSCVARIEEILVGQTGVKDAKVDLASGQARVSLTPAASSDAIVAAVTEAGYTMTPLS